MHEAEEQVEYEAPELAEVGDFGELTRGYNGVYFDILGGGWFTG